MERKEIRGTPRYAGHLRVSFGLDAGDLHFAETVNLSTAGALIRTCHLLRQDIVLILEIFLPGREEPLRCRGRVVWLNRSSGQWPLTPCGEMGVEFLDLSPQDKCFLQGYLQREGAV